VLSKLHFREHKAETGALFIQSRWQEVTVDGSDTRIIFAHVPDYVKPKSGTSRKEIYWQYLTEHAKQHKEGKVLIVGDLNTGLPMDGPGFCCVKFFKMLLDMGYKDMWREYHPQSTEYTWYSRSNGFRLDHAFASPYFVSSIGGVFYSHQEREQGISDHSILIIEMV
jgi:exodeoxyribonuclease-3